MPDNGSRKSTRVSGPKLIALAGPFQSGKTTLLESILARTGALSRQGSVRDGSTVGDGGAEARTHAMSVEANIASTEYLGDRYTFIDCPGSIEFNSDLRNVLPLCDAVVVVCEADVRKIPALQLIMREIEILGIPRFLFLNKIDQTATRVRDTLAMMQPASQAPMLLRQIPIWQNGIATGFIDLALERAFVYREHAPSVVIDVPAGEMPREKEARYSMLERLADYDDELMEELLSDMEPPRDLIFDDLARELRAGHAVPLLLGSAERGNGVTRLLKALRHEAPGLATTQARLGIEPDGAPLAHIFRTTHTAHGGKLSLARVLRGSFADGAVTTNGAAESRIAGISRLMGATSSKQESIGEGDTAAFGRLDEFSTGDSMSTVKTAARVKLPVVAAVTPPPPVHSFALNINDRKDEVKLAAALHKLIDEDPSLQFEHDQQSGEMRLFGQGEMHLRVALEKLANRYGITVKAGRPAIAYRETIREAVNVRGRHKKQSGGHGQYGDVVLEVKPLARGEGVKFNETVHGGTVPRNYFSSVEAGCQDALTRGPLGFPVVDVAATLTDGSYHAVDSSDMAFRLAARIGMSEALARARPVLLEPIMSVDIMIPDDAMSRVSGLVSARRGQILGFDARPGWEGWDVLRVLMPQADMDSLIVELRSATAGVATYTAQFDHLAEMTGKPAETVISNVAQQRAMANGQ